MLHFNFVTQNNKKKIGQNDDIVSKYQINITNQLILVLIATQSSLKVGNPIHTYIVTESTLCVIMGDS